MTTPLGLASHTIRAVGQHPNSDFKVGLHLFRDLGLIVKARTGVVYTNQGAGYARTRCEAEGFFAPLRVRGGSRALYALQDLFGGERFVDFNPRTADEFDRVLRHAGLDSIRADRFKLDGSVEAWIHVIASGGNDF